MISLWNQIFFYALNFSCGIKPGRRVCSRINVTAFSSWINACNFGGGSGGSRAALNEPFMSMLGNGLWQLRTSALISVSLINTTVSICNFWLREDRRVGNSKYIPCATFYMGKVVIFLAVIYPCKNSIMEAMFIQKICRGAQNEAFWCVCLKS